MLPISPIRKRINTWRLIIIVISRHPEPGLKHGSYYLILARRAFLEKMVSEVMFARFIRGKLSFTEMPMVILMGMQVSTYMLARLQLGMSPIVVTATTIIMQSTQEQRKYATA